MAETTPLDLDMATRIVDGDAPATVDMGCYEDQGGESIGGGGPPPVLRMELFLRFFAAGRAEADTNRDGRVDAQDVAAFRESIVGR